MTVHEHEHEQDGAALLRPLAGGRPMGPSTVDVARAMADGDRHHRRVRIAGAGATAVIVAVAGWAAVTDGGADKPAVTGASPNQEPGRSTGPKGCEVQKLAEGKAVVSGSDPTGRYIVGRTYESGHPSTVVWEDRQLRKVPMPGDDPTLYDATSKGVLVGTSFTTADTTTAWVYKDGKFSKLAGTDAQAFAINERGVIVGSVQGRAAMWASPDAQPTMLATPAKGMTGKATGIDEDGTVVGALVGGEAKADLGYVWSPAGTVQQLPQPQVNGKPATTYSAKAIRDGWVVGWAGHDDPARGGGRFIGAPRWNLRTGQFDMADGLMWVVNAQGRIAGEQTIVAPDGTTQKLPLPAGYDEKTAMLTVEALSDDGTVVAGYLSSRGSTMNAEPVAVTWSCTS
ncbi:hypothetical protein GCM10009827_020630 [Dactylosporangium maewongense]|uniref:Uncharacterized protein n=1 Tax=Dactylosporangium maewongense TaxID=634393 RepID=A0ABN1ZYI1_9ACTN